MEVVPVTVPRCQTCIWLFSTMTTVVRNPYWGVNPSETFTWEHCRRTRNIIGIVFILRFGELNKRYNWDKKSAIILGVLWKIIFVWSQKFCSAFCSPSAFYLILYTVLGVTRHNGRPPIERLQFFSPTPTSIFRFYTTEWYLCYARIVQHPTCTHTGRDTPWTPLFVG